jgi:hypothetical protein
MARHQRQLAPSLWFHATQIASTLKFVDGLEESQFLVLRIPSTALCPQFPLELSVDPIDWTQGLLRSICHVNKDSVAV